MRIIRGDYKKLSVLTRDIKQSCLGGYRKRRKNIKVSVTILAS